MTTPEEVSRQNYEFSVTREALKPLPLPHLTGMKLAGDIILGDFIFNTIDEFGVVWVITDIGGWWTPPEPDVVDIPRGFGDGSYDVKGRYKARSLTFNGTILVPDPSLLEAARDRLVFALDLVYKGAWLKTGTDPIRAAWVRSVGAPSIETMKARGRTDFSFTLRAPDPIKYMWNDADPEGYFTVEGVAANRSNPSAGTLSVTNQGNYPVPVYFEIIGPLAGPATIFNKTTEELIIITEGLEGAKSSFVVNKQLDFSDTELVDIATLTTRAKHNFFVGDNITVSGLGDPFDGDYVIKSVPTDTTFTYERIPAVASVFTVSYKSLSSGVATLETLENHNYQPGNQINVYGVDSVFNGTYTTLSGTTGNIIRYAKTRVPPQTVIGSILAGNIATLTTSAPHFFTVGDTVSVTNIDFNYNGSFTITGIPSSTQFSYAATRTNARTISNISMTGSVVTAATTATHGFVVGERVVISNLSSAFDGVHTITSVTSNTFTFTETRPTFRTVVSRARFSNSAALTTSEPHNLEVGESVQITNVESSFNGTFTVTGTPSPTTFTYTNNGSAINPTAVVDGRMEPLSRKIGSAGISGNVATILTKAAHGALVGESITVAGVPLIRTIRVSNKQMTSGKAILTTASPHGLTTGVQAAVANVGNEFNGIVVVTVTSPTVFEYQTSSNETNVASTPIAVEDNASVTYATAGSSTLNGTFTVLTTPNENTLTFGTTGPNTPVYNIPESFSPFVTLNQTVASSVVNGTATVSGALPFRSVNGIASVSNTFVRTPSGGTVARKSNVIFTPGQDGSVVTEADLLEIDTQNREVAFNGETVGARGRIDVLADFIRLTPGENIIEFKDEGSPDGQATMKILYRSGWLA